MTKHDKQKDGVLYCNSRWNFEIASLQMSSFVKQSEHRDYSYMRRVLSTERY